MRNKNVVLCGTVVYGPVLLGNIRYGALRPVWQWFGMALYRVALKDSLELAGVRFPCYLQCQNLAWSG